MQKIEFRTYKRRNVTRKSGFKASGETTGGECKIRYSERLHIDICPHVKIKQEKLDLVKIFQKKLSIIAFGGYIFCQSKTKVVITLTYFYQNQKYLEKQDFELSPNLWSAVGLHSLINLNKDNFVTNLEIDINFVSNDTFVDIYDFNFGTIKYDYFKSNDVSKTFFTKTGISVPYIFYFENNKKLIDIASNLDNSKISKGNIIVLKSCNRCKRFLPINNDSENTLAYSLHCKKRSPCKHSLFSKYKIIESDVDFDEYKVGDYFRSLYGHQLECKACKKFFVNAPLNPQRSSQQHKEDSLRRRAFEVLVNTLLQKNIIHLEFKNKTQKEFCEYIWTKFDKKCFKCKKPLDLDEMNLDHTLPLAFLYPLDETATCLCASHNASKNDHFPSEFYSQEEILELSKITGLSIEKLSTKSINNNVLDLLIENVEWFFDDFLMNDDYQKVRHNILTADKIYASLVRVLPKNVNLIELYIKKKGKVPSSITII